ncbi:hypothetical protein FNV43_RR21802 [Rhamnella rubrinervis]|uniref:BZIP domain-containing protein n=1 Tax=Rhamnella rubrinervis TaxID=2594499 RepID=A0A8K0DP13_9ROSA|nr:hypothetical protein FNV43_RR21802 [Rhamnella rubrinervis]
MDDSELDLSIQEVFSTPNIGGEIPSSSMDSFFDDLLMDTHYCSHTHTCNPPGPDSSHTHTCLHVHSKFVPASTDDKAATDDNPESAEKKSKKRPLGNLAAVRKYREKKKTEAASLEDEVVNLRAQNQHLLKMLQGQAALEAENERLKCLLFDIRGRIDGVVGTFPYLKTVRPNMPNPSMPGAQAYVMNPCNVQCEEQIYCLHPDVDGKCGNGVVLKGQGFSDCEFESLQCLAHQNSGKNFPGCRLGTVAANVNSSGTNKGKGKASLCLHG